MEGVEKKESAPVAAEVAPPPVDRLGYDYYAEVAKENVEECGVDASKEAFRGSERAKLHALVVAECQLGQDMMEEYHIRVAKVRTALCELFHLAPHKDYMAELLWISNLVTTSIVGDGDARVARALHDARTNLIRAVYRERKTTDADEEYENDEEEDDEDDEEEEEEEEEEDDEVVEVKQPPRNRRRVAAAAAAAAKKTKR